MVSRTKFFLALSLIVTHTLLLSVFAYAEDEDDIRQKIDEQQVELNKLDEEIAEYERELTTVSREKNTLQSAVRTLDISRNNVEAKVQKTMKQIGITEVNITDITEEIKEKEKNIKINTDALANTLRMIHEEESDTFVEMFLRSDTISDIWSDIETLRRFQSVIQIEVEKLTAHKLDLEDSINIAKTEHDRLSGYNDDLTIQKRSLDINREAKNNLLSDTKNKESNYQALIARKLAAREEFERQLSEYESQLRFVQDPDALPEVGQSVLNWPLKKIRITQYFGNTKFAQSGAYNGSGHNGIDFGIPLGSPVKVALSGTVLATGNTDAYSGCLSYGKWVLIKHNNGLSTMYAHLSEVIVSEGETLVTGDVFAHSGSSGYSTGPHLHFGVYASSGVQVVKIGDMRKSTYCKNARIPIAPWEAYINPMDYLPN